MGDKRGQRWLVRQVPFTNVNGLAQWRSFILAERALCPCCWCQKISEVANEGCRLSGSPSTRGSWMPLNSFAVASNRVRLKAWISCVVERPFMEVLQTMRNALSISQSTSKVVNWKRCSRLCASKSVTGIVGFRTVDAGKLYNAAAVFHGGKVVGIYRKRHPAIGSRCTAQVIKARCSWWVLFSSGIMICNYSNYPELTTDMVTRGASTIFVPSDDGLPPERADVVAWRGRRCRAGQGQRGDDRSSGRCRPHGGQVSFGSSAIVDARGTVLRGEPLSEDILVAEVHVRGQEVVN